MDYFIFSLSLLLIYLGLALLLHIQFGILGIANFGVVGFWGLGMYAMGVLQTQLDLSFVDCAGHRARHRRGVLLWNRMADLEIRCARNPLRDHSI